MTKQHDTMRMNLSNIKILYVSHKLVYTHIVKEKNIVLHVGNP